MKNKSYPILDQVELPSDIRDLDVKELQSLASDIREYILDTISKTGGHLAAGLGTVELSIALHYVFNTPVDKIIWDIGHQCYPHKILTGRKNKLDSVRKYNGISGFLKIKESEYDVFGAGHSSTSISAALGMAIARDIQNKKHKIISIIGDGGMTAGMSYEAMCHAGYFKTDMLVILNDNEMSISPNVGALNKYLTRLMSAIKEKGNNLLDERNPIKKIAKAFAIFLIGFLSSSRLLPFSFIADINLVRYLFSAPTLGDIDISLSLSMTSISVLKYPA